MSHIDRGDVHAYLDGALGAYTEEAARHVREHLDTCGECGLLLQREKRLREEASVILAASAAGPVQLDPLEELLARAVTTVGRTALTEGEVGSRRANVRTGKVRPIISRMYSLRWAATVVVSLGAGWIARDLSRSREDSVGGVVGEGVVTQAARSSVEPEDTQRDNAGRLPEQETAPQSPATAGGARVDSETPRETADAVTVGLAGGVGPSDSRGATPEALGLDSDPRATGDDRGLDRVGAAPARERALEVAARGVAPTDANAAAAAPRAEISSLSDELRSPITVSSMPFLVPGLPVRDVRLESEAGGPAPGVGGSVTVTQELGDGRQIELRFVPLAESDAFVGGAFQEWSDSRGGAHQVGWATTARGVPGGVAVLSGPLTEPELAELLALALGVR